jgi:RNA polymerase sigma factor (sigma-70 family)
MNLYTLLISPNEKDRNEGYKQLFFNQKIRSYLKKRIGIYQLHSIEIDEVMQDGLIRLQQKILDGTFRGESTVETFLTGICKFILLEKSKEKSGLETFSASEHELSEDAILPIEWEEKTQEEKQMNLALNKAIESLRENCREALRNYYFKNMTTAVIAEINQLSSANMAKKLLYRCRQYLRDAILNDPRSPLNT